MKARPLSESTALYIIPWRNECRESLRTPGYTTVESQLSWHETINRPESDILYWEFRIDIDQADRPIILNELAGVGGLVNIDRHNRSAELAVFVNPACQRQGFGRKIVDWLIDEAFSNQNMHKVWLEVYRCNPNFDAWVKILNKYRDLGRVSRSSRIDQKFFDGQYWSSEIWDVWSSR